MAEQLRQEQKDVDRLTGISLEALFYTLIGKKDEKLTQEEAELLQAKLKYEEASDTVADIKTELEQLKRRLSEVRYIETEIAMAMEEKRKLIYEASPELAAELQELTESIADLQANVKELQEAASAGRYVISDLSRAE